MDVQRLLAHRRLPIAPCLAALLASVTCSPWRALAEVSDAAPVELEARAFSLTRRHHSVSPPAARANEPTTAGGTSSALRASKLQMVGAKAELACAPPDSFFLDGYEADQP